MLYPLSYGSLNINRTRSMLPCRARSASTVGSCRDFRLILSCGIGTSRFYSLPLVLKCAASFGRRQDERAEDSSTLACAFDCHGHCALFVLADVTALRQCAGVGDCAGHTLLSGSPQAGS